MLGTFISPDRTEKAWELDAQRLKNSPQTQSDRGEVRTPATASVHHTPGPQSYRDSTRDPIYHKTAPKPSALSHKTWFPNYSIAHLGAVLRPLQGLFAGGKPLVPLPSTRGDLGRPWFPAVGFAEPGVSSYTYPSSSVWAQAFTGCHVAELSLLP